MMGFIYNEDRNIFIHMPTGFMFAGDYILTADNAEIRTKFYEQTGRLVEDFAIGMMRAKVKDAQTV